MIFLAVTIIVSGKSGIYGGMKPPRFNLLLYRTILKTREAMVLKKSPS
jgi:hypothetical protein